MWLGLTAYINMAIKYARVYLKRQIPIPVSYTGLDLVFTLLTLSRFNETL